MKPFSSHFLSVFFFLSCIKKCCNMLFLNRLEDGLCVCWGRGGVQQILHKTPMGDILVPALRQSDEESRTTETEWCFSIISKWEAVYLLITVSGEWRLVHYKLLRAAVELDLNSTVSTFARHLYLCLPFLSSSDYWWLWLQTTLQPRSRGLEPI